MKKIKISSELTYLFAITLMAFAVAMTAAADFGVSMIVAPAYLTHIKIGFLTFGQCEYVLQAVLFIVLCLLLRKVRPLYFVSFATCIFYGAVLDGWRNFVPLFNAEITAPGSMETWLRWVLLIGGMVLTSLAVALLFRVYLYPQVYDFFVKAVTEHFSIDRTKFKTCFDIACLLISLALSFLFFGKLNGIGIGTLIMTLCNGPLIGLIGKILDKTVDIRPTFKKIAQKFDL